jgi:hypothetical protein
VHQAGLVLEPVFAHLGVEFRSYNFAQGGMGTFQQVRIPSFTSVYSVFRFRFLLFFTFVYSVFSPPTGTGWNGFA